MNILGRFKNKIDYLIAHPQNYREAFHILSTEYVLILNDFRNAPVKKDYLEYFAVHELFNHSMDVLIVESNPEHQYALKCFKTSIAKIHDDIKKEYHKKNSFMTALAARFCK